MYKYPTFSKKLVSPSVACTSRDGLSYLMERMHPTIEAFYFPATVYKGVRNQFNIPLECIFRYFTNKRWMPLQLNETTCRIWYYSICKNVLFFLFFFFLIREHAFVLCRFWEETIKITMNRRVCSSSWTAVSLICSRENYRIFFIC